VKGRKTGGRKAGTRNRRTVESERAATEAARKISATIKGAFEGDAHELLMAVYKDPDQPLQVRIDAAKAALPFEKARVATEPKQPEKERGPIKITFALDQADDRQWHGDQNEFTLALDHPDDGADGARDMAARTRRNGDPQ
jgi:hypothetical protein